MGNSEVGHLTIGSGPRPVPGPDARQRRRPRRLAVRERRLSSPRSRGRGSAAATCTSWASSRRAASTRTSTTCSRCSSSPQREGMADADVDPRVHRRPRRLAPRGASTDLARLPAGRASRRSWAATTRWTATTGPSAPSARCAAILDGEGDARRRPGRGRRRRATSAASTDEFVEPIVLPAAPRARAGHRQRAIFFNFRPDRGRQLSRRLLERGVDLTTMTRYARGHRDAGRVPRAGRGATRSPRRSAVPASGSCTPPRPRSTRTSPTSSTAARRPSGRGRRACSCRRRATSPSYDLKPEMSAAGVADEVVARAAARATASASSTSRTPTWSATRA